VHHARRVLGMLKKLWPFGSDGAPAASAAMGRLVSELHFELVPMASIEGAIGDLPDGAEVSLTCSPTKGIPATQRFTERLVDAGFHVVPHLAARMVAAPADAVELAAWTRRLGLDEVYVIAGDAPEAHGPYPGTLAFLHDYLAAGPGVARVGIAGYPDGHAFIDAAIVDEQLMAKQRLLDDHGVGGWISTQMCFDATTIRAWIERERARGVVLPIRLGIPGVVDRTRLMTMGARLGVGASLRFLSKNRSTVMQLMAPGGYDPTELVAAFAEDADALGIEALHAFTFNSVADTRAWQEAILDRAGRRDEPER
jgi:methylenetetrahydrofolate reductase (NADPH)